MDQVSGYMISFGVTVEILGTLDNSVVCEYRQALDPRLRTVFLGLDNILRMLPRISVKKREKEQN